MSRSANRPALFQRGSAIAWSGLTLLLVIGIVAAIARATHVGSLGAAVEPLREGFLNGFGIADPDPARRADAVTRADLSFGTHGLATLFHVGSGALLFILVPPQFSRTIRARHPALHRWSGRMLIVTAWVTGVGGLFFGILHPFAGAPERIIIGAVGGWFLFSITMGFVMIRRRQPTKHREWMIRAVAGALSVSTVRLVVLPIDVVLTSRGMPPEHVLVSSFVLGWFITLFGAEWWIRRTATMRFAPA